MYKNGIKYGIVLVSGKEYKCYIIEVSGSHKQIKLINSNTHQMQKGHRRGGSSASRFRNIKEEKDNAYYEKVAEIIVKSYMTDNNTKCIVNKLIIAGPGDIKNEVVQENVFRQYFSSMYEVVTTSEIIDTTIFDVCKKYDHVFASYDENYGQKAMEKINNLININPDKLVFGIKEILNALESKNLTEIIVSSDMDEKSKTLIRTKIINNCNMYEIADNNLKGYGKIIGIKKFVNQFADIDSIDSTSNIESDFI